MLKSTPPPRIVSTSRRRVSWWCVVNAKQDLHPHTVDSSKHSLHAWSNTAPILCKYFNSLKQLKGIPTCPPSLLCHILGASLSQSLLQNSCFKVSLQRTSMDWFNSQRIFVYVRTFESGEEPVVMLDDIDVHTTIRNENITNSTKIAVSQNAMGGDVRGQALSWT